MIEYRPIGFFSCEQTSPVESPRQGILSETSQGKITLEPSFCGNTLKDLAQVDRLWLLYDFHHNKSWKALVRPPRGGAEKRGVFATRSPYRPNSIGMSCVKLDGVTHQSVLVSQHDLLDGTPILDIKPYLNYSDSFPEAQVKWLHGLIRYEVSFSDLAKKQLDWLSELLNLDLVKVVQSQLEYEPVNSRLKRVKAYQDGFIFSYKVWRLFFSMKDNQVLVSSLTSGYSRQELENNEDPFADKDHHRQFLQKSW